MRGWVLKVNELVTRYDSDFDGKQSVGKGKTKLTG